MSTTKVDYETIPDVEIGNAGNADTRSAKEKYPDLEIAQADLICSFDAVVAGSASSLDLATPKISQEELVVEGGSSLLVAMIVPTVAALCMVGVAFGVSGVGGFLENSFPYIDAVILFLASVWPIQNRFMITLTPVIDIVGSSGEKVRECVRSIGTDCDSQIGTLQLKSREVMEPMRATLDTAHSQEKALKNKNPDLTIPDSDVDMELEDIKGIVPAKIEEALQQLVLDAKYIPGHLKSSGGFFWSAAFPSFIVVLLLQLLAAWILTVTSQERALWIDVCVAYGVAVVEIIFVFLLTNKHFRVREVNSVTETMTEEARRLLSTERVPATVDNVYGVRIAGVKQKLLIIFQNYKQLDKAVAFLESSTEPGTPDTIIVETASQDSTSPKRRGLLSRILSPQNT